VDSRVHAWDGAEHGWSCVRARNEMDAGGPSVCAETEQARVSRLKVMVSRLGGTCTCKTE
jgi:hypothetical protein